jgi:putative addiction module antidote
MSNRLTLRKIGSSTGVILPKAELDRLHLQEGDELYLIETPNGLELTPYDPEFDAQMKSAEKVLKKYRNTLRELAK